MRSSSTHPGSTFSKRKACSLMRTPSEEAQPWNQTPCWASDHLNLWLYAANPRGLSFGTRIIFSNRDLVTEQVLGTIKRKVVIRNNRGYGSVQESASTKAGDGDQKLTGGASREVPYLPSISISISSAARSCECCVQQSGDTWADFKISRSFTLGICLQNARSWRYCARRRGSHQPGSNGSRDSPSGSTASSATFFRGC